ncbi:MAG: HU family DNA-binding protein, partial [Erysipelotrichaceae bacterium]|nr:HU family DNA-binding protein [Erysipelotrichaceae bacterium]
MSKDLNKKALADAVAEKTGITKKAANELVDVTFKTIIETLIDGG